MHRAILWETSGKRIRCNVCPNRCSIAEGHTGVCGVRRNEGGVLDATTYGLVSSLAVDPIEKKPVFHYMPGSAVLSLGSVGCSMSCGHCQNWRISRASPGDSGVKMHALDPEAVISVATDSGCPGVAFTYNEPVIWIEYVLDVAKAAQEAGLFTVMVTNGYITVAALDVIGPYIDVWRCDIKGATDATYKRLCNVSGVEAVHEAARRARHHHGMHVEVVTNVVPTVNDSPSELGAVAEWIASDLGPETPWHVTRFFPYLDFSELDPTPAVTLRTARRIGGEAGLRHVYLGNIDEAGGEDTLCPGCGAVAIARSGYTITARRTSHGACSECGSLLNIVES